MSIDPAIAAQMGFSSFGGASATKKRKYNDASYVDGQQDHKSSLKAPTGSGANNIALGTRPNKGSAASTRRGDGDAVDAPVNAGMQEPVASAAAKGKSKEKQASGLAAFLSRGQTLPGPSKSIVDGQSGHVTSESMARPSVRSSGNTQVESSGTQSNTQKSHGQDTQHGIEAYKRGVQNEKGDMVYFLPSFLEDPWKDLRQNEA